MARRSKVKVGNDSVSKLHDALRTGVSPVGLKGYVATDFYDAEHEEVPIIIKVEIVELKADCNGVNVLVKPASGSGTFKISPCKWFDTEKEFHKQLEQQRVLDEASNDYQLIMGHSLITARKDRLLNLVNESQDRFDIFKKELIELGYAVQETSEKNLLKKVHESLLKQLTLAMVCLKHQVDEETLKSTLGYRY